MEWLYEQEEAVKKVNEVKYNFPYEYLLNFSYHQLTKDEFSTCLDKWRNRNIWHKVNGD